MKDPSDIKMSSLDVQAPPNVEVVFRFTEPYSRNNPRPAVMADFTSLTAAQEFAQNLRRKKIGYNFLTWWRRNGQHVHKWATLMAGRRRFFRLSVPYVEGVNDAVIKALVVNAILTSPLRPTEYVEGSVRLTVDPDANRAAVAGHLLVNMAVPSNYAEQINDMSVEQQAELITRAMEGKPT